MQQNRLAIANVDLQKAQAELDAKQAELDVVQAEYEKAMMEKQVNSFTYFLPQNTRLNQFATQKQEQCVLRRHMKQLDHKALHKWVTFFVTFSLLRLINEHLITYSWTFSVSLFH